MSSPEGGDSLWRRLWRVPQRRWLLGIPLGAVLAVLFGAGGMVGFIGAVEMSSTEEFCISCHEMRDNVYAEYKGTIHDTSRSGVRATCPDCHVPGPWIPKLIRKIGATFNEVPGHIMGRIDTPAKFQAKREEMAKIVWDAMKGNDSRECRACHTADHMNFELQDKSAVKKHKAMLEKGDKTCIDCHQGIAHKEPAIEADTAPAAD